MEYEYCKYGVTVVLCNYGVTDTWGGRGQSSHTRQRIQFIIPVME
jgi:hypothetical protein